MAYARDCSLNSWGGWHSEWRHSGGSWHGAQNHQWWMCGVCNNWNGSEKTKCHRCGGKKEQLQGKVSELAEVGGGTPTVALSAEADSVRAVLDSLPAGAAYEAIRASLAARHKVLMHQASG